MVPDLPRILALPRRQPLDCDRDRKTKRWTPEAQALIEVMTAKFTRGPRISCACRNRHLRAMPGGDLVVFTDPIPNHPPGPPVLTKVADFLRDSAHDAEVVPLVSKMRPGDRLDLPGLGRHCITELNPVQAWALKELPQAGGIFGFIPVGFGKSLLSILSPLAMPGAKNVILLGKSDQRLHYRTHYLHAREHFQVPSLVMDQSDGRGSFMITGRPILRFIPYSILQREEHRLLLESHEPDMIISDEAHSLARLPGARRGVGSGRAIRVFRYMGRRNSEGKPVVFLCWSGSLINKTVLDVTHLSAFSLGMGSPYPIDLKDTALAWSGVLDPSRSPDTTSTTAKELRRAFGPAGLVESPNVKLTPLQASGILDGYDDSIRLGLQKRVRETLGVISARSAAAASTNLHKRVPERAPPSIEEALEKVRSGERPDGDLIVEQEKQIAIAKQVGCGFYMYWAFPGIPCNCPPGLPNTCDGCKLIEDWYEKRRAYGKKLREKLCLGEVHLDTPRLCYNAAKRAYQVPRYDGDLPVWPESTWLEWAEVEHKVPHESRVRWIDDFLVKDAAAWAKEHTGIVWYESVAFGRAVAKEAGIPFHGGGPDAEAKILAESGKTSICASISSHSEGRDGLQFKFSKQLVTEPMASGKAWDQLLGRLSRAGQKEDEVETWVYLHTREHREAFRKAVELAEFDEEMSPQESLLLAAHKDF